MISSLVDPEPDNKYGRFSSELIAKKDDLFAGVVSVAFSAFDEREPYPEKKDKSVGIKYSYVGLKRVKKADDADSGLPKTPTLLNNEFYRSLRTCKTSGRSLRWKNAIHLLETDPIFQEANVAGIIDIEDREELKETASQIFRKLSSGHKIVLLTITRLIEAVEERSLVIIDEPEAHLHPPLLSAFVRVVSELLIQRNGVAIIATHSPVVLQEVPMRCAYRLRRTGAEATVERLERESFGENVGELTQEIFGLEVTYSGFHKLLKDAISESDNYDDIIESFNGELGMEARAIVRALLLNKAQ